MIKKLLLEKSINNGLKEFFPKTEVAKKDILIEPSTKHASLLGNSYDLMLSCMLGINNTYLQTQVFKPFEVAIESLSESFVEGNTVLYYKGVGYPLSEKFITINDLLKDKNVLNQFPEQEHITTNTQVFELLSDAQVKLEDIFTKKKILKTHLKSLIIASQILPAFSMRKFAKNVGVVEDDLINLLNDLKQATSKELISQAKEILINPHIHYSIVDGRPDYVFHNTILDIKTTKKFFARIHLNQVLIYFLLHLSKETESDFRNYDSDFSERNIDEIALYYPLYGTVIKINMIETYGEEIIQKALLWFNNELTLFAKNKLGLKGRNKS